LSQGKIIGIFTLFDEELKHRRTTIVDALLREQIYQKIIEGDRISIVPIVEAAIKAGEPPLPMISEILNPALRKVGEGFSDGIIYLPELIMSAEAMQAAMDVLQPIIEARKEHVTVAGRVVIATVQGDIHDIGKNIVCSLLRANGFEVLDLGKDVPAAEIVAKAESFKADVIGLSSLLGTTLPYCRDTVNLLVERGIREKYLVFIGGGAATPEYARSIGAEYGGPHAEAGVAIMLKALQKG
jgi:5-methyltetrahydrofolate--homocysteine methyltransferase